MTAEVRNPPIVDYDRHHVRAAVTFLTEVLEDIKHHGEGNLDFDHSMLLACPYPDSCGIPDHVISAYKQTRIIPLVLQNVFYDLNVDSKVGLVHVTLRFGGRNTRLRIPFNQIVLFQDHTKDVSYPIYGHAAITAAAEEETPETKEEPVEPPSHTSDNVVSVKFGGRDGT